MREIADYQRQKGLNIVYEESDEESIRKKTMRSMRSEEEDFKEEAYSQIEREAGRYRFEQERLMKQNVA